VDAQAFDLVVIGAGPGGYIAAIRGAQLGLKVACIEKEPALGGTCLRVGCIPSKALLESSERFAEARHGLAAHGVVTSGVSLDLGQMMKRKESIVRQLTHGVAGLFKKNGVTRFAGTGRLTGRGRVAVDGATPAVLDAKHVIIATGSRVAPLPGIEFDGDRIGTSTEALSYPTVPEHLVVIGAGVIGLELGSVWSRLGARVTVLEYQDRILPGTDAEIAALAQKSFAKQGLTFQLGVRVTGARVEGEGVVVERAGGEPIRADRVLVAIGRTPQVEGLGLEAVGLTLDARGRIPVDEHFATAVPGIYAIGDVIPGPMLAHKAEEDAVACVERIVTGYGHVDYGLVPNVVYTMPEVASVGQNEEELTRAAVPFRKGTFPFMANGRAKAFGVTDGLVKILAHAETDRILGVHIFGPWAGELIAEATAAMTYGATAEDLARTCHAHPTLSEALKEAALAVDGRTLNL
jgi:dihydrolipoamide dehydrogenase